MEKIISIGGKPTRFKSNGVSLLVYKANTGRDMIPDLVKMTDSKGDISGLDLQVLYDVCWTFAKIADASIPPVMEWLETFDAFPVADVFREVMELVAECITCSAEVKNAIAAAGLRRKAIPSKRNGLFSRRHK